MLCTANSKFSSKSPGGLEKSVWQQNLQKPKEIENLISAALKFGAFLVFVVFLDFNITHYNEADTNLDLAQRI